MSLNIKVALLLAVAAVSCFAGRNAMAQNQPDTATNQQNEQININRDVGKSVDNFTVLRTGDKAEMNRFISRVVELKSNPYEMLPHVLKAVTKEKGAARGLKYKDPETSKERYFIQIITTEEQMASVIDSVKEMDLPGMVSSEGDQKWNYRLKYRKASDVAKILQATTLSGEGKVGFDDVSNTLYLTDSPSDSMREFMTAQFYDVPPPQVEFDVLAVEFNCDDGGALGVDWDAWKRNLGGQLGFTGNLFEGNNKGFQNRGFYRFDALLTLDASALADFLNYTTLTGNGEVITRSKLTAANNRLATLSSGRRVPYQAYSTVFADAKELLEKVPGVSATGENPDSTVLQDRPVVIQPPSRSVLTEPPSTDEGVTIKITPTIGTEMVTAEFNIKVTSLSGYSKLGTPVMTERSVDTMATLRDKQTFCLGAFDKYTMSHSRKGIPGLKELPIAGRLFGTENQVTRRSKIFVVVTPRFVNQVKFTGKVIEGTPPKLKDAPEPLGIEKAAMGSVDTNKILHD